MSNEELQTLRRCLKSGEYDGVHIMQAWLVIDELIELREFRENAFKAHPNLDMDIDGYDANV
jgi:hypothetical protein